MSRRPSDDAPVHRRFVGPWRIAFVAYAIALTTGTHWPQLQFGPQIPATDKTIHFLAFGGLTVLLWRTGWLRPGWLVVIVALLWSALDEISQGIPGVNRQIGAHDVVANMLGVLAVAGWAWALAPVGGPSNRLRLDFDRFAFERVFLRPSTWLVLAALLVGGVLVPLLARSSLTAAGTARAILSVAGAATVAAGSFIGCRWVRERRRVAGQRACFRCGSPGRAGEPESADDPGICPACASPLLAGQWTIHHHPPAALWQAWRRPGSIGLVAAAVLLLALALLTRDAEPARTALPNLLVSVRLTLVLTVAAVVTRVARRRLARRYDDDASTSAAATPCRNASNTTHGPSRC